MKRITFFIAALIIGTLSFAADYMKVTSAPQDWSGEYILVYDATDSCLVWNGVDAASAYVKTTPAENIITGENLTTITIAPMEGGYAVLINGEANDGKYIGGKNGDNGLIFNAEEALLNTFEYDTENSGVLMTSNTSVMRFNKARNQMRFRYFKEATFAQQQIVQLYKKVVVEPVVKTGAFSVAENRQVEFAPGNLQFHTGDSIWRFAENQYSYIGKDNINIGDPDFKGWIDMFGWSTTSTYYGVNPSNKNENYTGDFVDWGLLFENEEWYTLSKDEWDYLLNERTNASALNQLAYIDTILGTMIFPDDWMMPENIEATQKTDENNITFHYYTIDQWQTLENAGAIFLPAAGRRTGGYGNMINYNQGIETRPEYLINGGYYRWHDNANYYCYYWTSSLTENNTVYYLINIRAQGDNNFIQAPLTLWTEKGRYGQSVRLARIHVTPPTIVSVSDATASVEGQNIVLKGTWDNDGNQTSVMINLWQGGQTQGFGIYSGEGEGDYSGLLGTTTMLYPLSDGMYIDNGDGTFTFLASMIDNETNNRYSISMSSASQVEDFEVTDSITINNTVITKTETTTNFSGSNEAYQISLTLNGVDYGSYDAVEDEKTEETYTPITGTLNGEQCVGAGKYSFNEELNSDLLEAIIYVPTDDFFYALTMYTTTTTAIENTMFDNASNTQKCIINGQLIIKRNNINYNAQGAMIK